MKLNVSETEIGVFKKKRESMSTKQESVSDAALKA